MPGLINTHTHVSMNLLRGLADDLHLIDWLTKEMWPTEAAFVSPSFCEAGSRHAVAEMLRCGTTCFNDMYFFPDATAQVCHTDGAVAAVAVAVAHSVDACASPHAFIPAGSRGVGHSGERRPDGDELPQLVGVLRGRSLRQGSREHAGCVRLVAAVSVVRGCGGSRASLSSSASPASRIAFGSLSLRTRRTPSTTRRLHV
jgi:hypothetical protein